MPIRRAMLALALLALASGHARAGPALAVRADTDCPDAGALLERFERWAAVTERADWRVAVERRGPRAALTLRGPDGVELRRQIASSDCDALARAFDVILQTHFRAVPTPIAIDAVPALAFSIDTDTTVRPMAPTAPPRGELRLELGAGAAMPTGPTPSAVATDVAAAGRPARWPVGLRAALSATGEARQPASDDDVVEGGEVSGIASRSVHLSLGVTRAIRTGGVVLEPSAGAGVAVVSARAMDLPDAGTHTRLQPTAELALGARRRLAGALHLMARAAGRLYVRADRYRIEPVGVVGASPRAELSLALGIAVDVR